MSLLSNIMYYVDIKPSLYFHWISTPEYVTEDSAFIDEMAEKGLFPKLQHLYPSFLFALVLGICRLFLQHLLFKNQGLKELVRETKLTEQEVNRQFWMLRRSSIQRKKMIKFTEAGYSFVASFACAEIFYRWRAIFYAVFCVVGYVTLFTPTPVPWVLSTKEHWTNWPIQEVYPMVRLYYIVELGAYYHQIMWTDVSRSDSLEMLIHHFVTIFLMLFSYLTNFTRIGTTVLIIHDVSDVFLESAKCFNYVSKVKGREWASTVCDILFGIFAVSFFVMRLVIYPVWVFYWSFIYVEERFGMNWVGFWIYFCLLMALQVLHIFWFYLISRMIYKLFTTGIEKDERSDDEEEDVLVTEVADSVTVSTTSSKSGRHKKKD